MIGITLMLPTRMRPRAAKDAITSAKDTAIHPDSVVVALRTDRDDTSDYTGVKCNHLLVGEKKGCSPAYQELAATFPNDMMMVFADDVRFRTRGWDEAFREVYLERDGKPFVLCPNDLHTKMATHPCVPRSWLQVFGKLWEPPFEHFYSDTWLDEIAREAGVFHFLTGIIAEHTSPKYDLMPKDETWHLARWGDKIGEDRARFKESKDIRDLWVQRIKEIYNG